MSGYIFIATVWSGGGMCRILDLALPSYSSHSCDKTSYESSREKGLFWFVV